MGVCRRGHRSDEPSRAPTRTLVCALALLAVAAVLLVVAAISLRPDPAADGVRLTPDADLLAEETPTALPTSPTPTPSPSATHTLTSKTLPTTSTSGANVGGIASPDAVVPPTRAPLMAFFRGEALWVAREDGSTQRQVARIADGVFALSPDGRVIALVRSGALSMIDVATGRVSSAGRAHGSRPVWTHDSSSVFYVRELATGAGDLEVWRVSASGVGARRVHAGFSPAVAPDGTIACLSAEGGVWILRQGRAPAQFPVQGFVTAVEVSSSQVVYATDVVTSGSRATELWTVRTDGSGARRILSETPGDRPFSIRELSLCPRQTHLLVTVTGDDGFSRTRVVEMATGRATPLAIRRDTYPIGWSADGIGIRLAEGNVFQGETSSIIAVRRDGTGRTLLAEDARIY
ncbi:MAG: hypothetical protein M1617_04255 [Actinobacteria bacterium]|nr:hypothetical protein [Actinomycetota bacterium]